VRRTFNYTGRRRIPLDLISIRVYSLDSGARWFDADLTRLHELKLPENARIFVEAYFERAYRRFAFGTVASIKVPEDRSLEEIDFGGRMQFRVKVTDVTGMHGKLLASAEEIIPALPQQDERAHESLLPVEPRGDMGQEVWRVNFDAGGPYLEVNSAIDGVMDLFRNNKMFAALVYPHALRTILTQVLLIHRSGSDDAGWEARWLRFGMLQVSTPAPDPSPGAATDEEITSWIDSVTATFATRLRGADFVREAQKEEKL
jgi:hypothetical protein